MIFLAVAAGVALLHAAYGSRRLQRHMADADFEERYLRYRAVTSLWVLLTAVAASMVAGWHALWIVGGLAGGVLAASFPVRRQALEETWTFWEYLGFRIRLLLGGGLFWLALLFAPSVPVGAGSWRWGRAALVALLLGGLLVGFRPLLLAALRVRPLRDGELAPALDRIDARAEVRPRERFVVPTGGGRWVNAMALPHRSRPVVVVSESLIEALDRAQAVAIYAHEVAHLEQYDRSRLRRRAFGQWSLVVVAALLSPVTAGWPDVARAARLSWPLLLLLLWYVRLRGSREREVGADRRAVELCGDPEAVAGALRAVHRLGLVPRRLARDSETSSTHPSLASRLRALAGPSAGEDPWATVVATSRAGEALVLAPDRIDLYSGAPDGTLLDPSIPSTLGRRRRSWSVDRLVELRLAPRLRGRSLVLAEATGRACRIPVPSAAVDAVQAALDRLDRRLVSSEAPGAHPLHRCLGLGSTLLGLLTPGAGAAMIVGLVAAWWPRQATLAALAATDLGIALVGTLGWTAPDPGASPFGDPSVLFAVLGAGALLLWRGVPPPPKTGWWPHLVLGAAGLAVAVPLARALVAAGDAPWLTHVAARTSPAGVTCLVGWSAALLVGRGRLRLLGGVVGVAAAFLLVLGTPWVGSRWGGDPLLGGPALGLRVDPYEVVGEALPLPGSPWSLRVGPEGGRFAVREGGSAPGRWRLGTMAAGPGNSTLSADELRFAGDSILGVRLSGGGTVVERWSPDGRLATAWQLPWPAVGAVGLETTNDGGWRLWGQVLDHGSLRLVAAESDAAERVSHFTHTWPGDARRPATGVPMGRGRWLVVEGPRSTAWSAMGPATEWLAGRGDRHALVILESGRRTPLLRSRSRPLCRPRGGGVVCAAGDGFETSLWRIGEDGRVRPLGRVPGRVVGLGSAPGGVLVERLAGDPVWVTRESAEGRLLAGLPPVEVALVADRSAFLIEWEGASPRLVRYAPVS